MAEATLLSEILKEVLRQMDPAACLQRAHDQLDDGNIDEARDALTSYREWRRRGGFEPEGGDQRADELEQMLIERGSRRSKRQS